MWGGGGECPAPGEGIFIMTSQICFLPQCRLNIHYTGKNGKQLAITLPFIV